MSKKNGLRLRPSPALEELIQLTGSEGEQTQRLNRVAERYMELIEACAPDLTEDEWRVVYQVLTIEAEAKGKLPGAGFWWVLVEDQPEVSARLGVDMAELVAKMQSWDTAAEIAAEELVDRAWAAEDEHSPTRAIS